MNSNNKNQLIILILSVVLSVAVLLPTFSKSILPEGTNLPQWWPSKKIKLGLDLRGGSYLVLGVQTKEAVKSQLNSIASTIKAELSKERIGIVKSRAISDNSIQITMLGESGVEQLDDYVRRKFPQLQRQDKNTDSSRVNVNYKLTEENIKDIEKNAVDQAIETIRNRVDQYGVAEPVIQRSGEKRIIVQLPDVTDLDNVKKTIGSVAKLEFHLLSDPANVDANTVPLKLRSGETLQMEEDALMTGDSVKSARVELNPRTNEIEVLLEFSAVGAQLFDQVTASNVGRRLAIVLDNVGYSAPVIRERISGGNAQISGGFTTEEAHRLAIILRSGALPAPLTFEEQRTVGASLGEDSIAKGLKATMFASILVIVFMILYYKKSGVVSILCLIVNLLWLLASLALFGSTLTLPGIAGLALTVGMAVDSNIIIFERIREEIRNGSTTRAAIAAGFDRAHWTILDANITTIISGILLYGFGTGTIKGYAVTLSIGIITTVLSALFASRLLFNVVKLDNSKGELSI